MNDLQPSPVLLCANCASPLQGAFCHDCGQSVKSVLQPVSHMLEDAGDLFFHLDERVLHTLPPLFMRPGFLTLEYFSGRRVRYIAPFRLMFVFGLLAFFALHLALSSMSVRFGDGRHGGEAPADSVEAFASAKTPGEVQTLYADQIHDLRESLADPNMPALARPGLTAAAGVVREAANARLAQLGAPALAATDDEPAALPRRSGEEKAESLLGKDPTVHVAWLPNIVNERLSAAKAHFKANLIQISNGGEQRQEGVQKIIEGFFSVLPQAMFLMLPVFAVILKLFYAFRRRLYMEHVIVALHSHAFIFIALLGLTLLGFAKSAIAPHAAIAGSAIGVLQFAMWVWIPVYLLIMQKRIYRQGWAMTIVKYWLIGSIYFWLLLFVMVIALAIGMTH